MALEPADWTVTRSTGAIRYKGGDHNGTAGDFGGTPGAPTYATVIDFHRWLQGLADDAVAVGNDELDITNTNPSQRSTDNIITLINNYNIDDTAAEHLYDGSVIQTGGADIYDGIVNFGNADVQIKLIQNGAVLADAWWNYNNAGLNADATSGISHRFMVKTRTGAADVDGRKLIGTCRRFGFTYSEFTINATSRGNNVLALTDSTDLNNQTASGTVGGWSAGFTNTEGYASLDINNDGTPEYYYSNWNIDKGTHPSINRFYEYTKYISRAGSSIDVLKLYGLDGELFRGITHQISLSGTSSGTFNAFEKVSWATGTGQMLAIDNTTAASATKMWIQLLTGSAPGTGVLITAPNPGSQATATTSGSATERTISKPFCGASTGSAIIGAYGLGIVAVDLNSTDKLTDLANDPPISPPNYVTNTLTGLVATHDRVLVAPGDGTSTDVNLDPAIIKTQMTLTSALTTDNVGSIQVTVTPFPPYTPATGFIRVIDNLGFERRLSYSAVNTTTKTFTIDSSDGNEDFATGTGHINANAGNNVYIAYIDGEAVGSTISFTSVHGDSSAMNLVIVVRDGGATPIKQYISRWTQGQSSVSTPIIRTSDT